MVYNIIMGKHYDNINKYNFLTKELLEEEYVINLLTDQQIADKYSIPSKAVVWRKRIKFGIQNRYSSKSNKHASVNKKFNITKEKAISLKKQGYTYSDFAEYLGCSISVAQRRLKDLGLCKEHKETEKYLFWNVNLTSSQKQLVIGSLLGDGSITKHKAFSCSHSTKQKDYFLHKMSSLQSIQSGRSQHAIHQESDKNNNNYESLHFTTGCNSYLSELRSIYYPGGTKIFPYQFLIDTMEAEALAYWYMDDGTYKMTSKNCLLCTYGYTALDNILMKDLIMQKWGIETNIWTYKERNENKCHSLFFTVKSTLRLFELIRPHIVPSMMYKLGEPMNG